MLRDIQGDYPLGVLECTGSIAACTGRDIIGTMCTGFRYIASIIYRDKLKRRYAMLSGMLIDAAAETTVFSYPDQLYVNTLFVVLTYL